MFTLLDALSSVSTNLFIYSASLTLSSLGVLIYIQEVQNITPMYFGHITLYTLMLFSTVSTLGFDTVNFVIPAEIFPLNVKSTAITSLNLFVSFLTFCIARGYQILKDFSGLYGVFWFFAFFAMAGAVFSYLVVPETKGKSLREIQQELQGELHEKQQEATEIKTQECGTKNIGESVDKDCSDELKNLKT